MAAKPTPAPKPAPPDIIAFDVLETLFPLAPLGPLLTAAGGDASTLALWFSRLLAEGFALTAARDFKSFNEVAKASLAEVLPHAKAAARDKVLAGLAALDPHADAGPAMGRAVLDARVIVITNGSQDSTAKLLARGGLDAFVETIVSADDVKAWKPKADAYSLAGAATGESADRIALVTAHPWDVLGARQAGLVTAWCNRSRTTFPATLGHPDVTGANLLDVVEGLFALKGGR